MRWGEGGEDNIELIITEALMSAPGEGWEKVCFPQLPQSPGITECCLLGPLLEAFF